jgi:hypothetical protein
MLVSLVYLVVRMLLRLLVRDGQGDAAKDLEIVVLRQQLNVLRRQVKRPRFRRSDRAFLTAAAHRLPRVRWERFLVTPKTLLCWHRELVRLKWARYSKRRRGRPPLSAEHSRPGPNSSSGGDWRMQRLLSIKSRWARVQPREISGVT